jgi:hypothetical protein
MKNSAVSLSWVTRRVLGLTGLACLSFSVTACYVVPIDARNNQAIAPNAGQNFAVVVPHLPTSFPARLYPANELASGLGLVNATVTSDLHGRGTFNTSINGESFAGEATRKAGSSNEGIANGTGNRGGFLSCNYTMNSSTMGTGTCRLHTGAVFTMHVGN